ncbi:hypothetical protein D3C87_1744190 [compost metagenome]
MPRVIVEGDGVDDAADHGEPGAVDQIPRQLFEFVSKLVPPSLLIAQGLEGSTVRRGGAAAQRLEKPVAVGDAIGPGGDRISLQKEHESSLFHFWLWAIPAKVPTNPLV